MIPTNDHVEIRNGGYYLAGTHLAWTWWCTTPGGAHGGSDFRSVPIHRLLTKVYGAITFILEHAKKINVYLEEQDRRYEEIKARYPLTANLIERF